MGMTRVIVPVYPGLTSAFGALMAEPKISQVWSKHFRSDAIDAKTVGEHFDDMVSVALDQLRREGYTGEPEIERSISMRYWGQNYEQDVPMPHGRGVRSCWRRRWTRSTACTSSSTATQSRAR